MVLYCLIWIFVFGFNLIIGIVSARLLNFSKEELTTDLHFFLGFLVNSILCSWVSIFLPINTWVLLFLVGVVLFIIALLKINVFLEIKLILQKVKGIHNVEKLVLFAFFTFTLLTVIGEIKNFDSGLYHIQNIKWIREYAVIPGLGNLHHRFAFNSMFFPVSALFTLDGSTFFDNNTLVLYPLNSVCFIVLILRLFVELKVAMLSRKRKEFVFLITILILGLLLFKKSLNSPSPDVITGILVIYVFIFLLKSDRYKFSARSNLLIYGLIFLAISFKLSAVFMILLILPWLIRKNYSLHIRALLIGLIIFLPFLIRNYYLSGYIIYPLAEIDLFTVDWKLPLKQVIHESNWITSWARIPHEDYAEVLAMKPWDWGLIWFQNLKWYLKILVILQLFLIYDLFSNLMKKNYLRFFIIVVLCVNVTFWLIKAPDPRFAFGFLIIGSAVSISNVLNFFSYNRSGQKRYGNWQKHGRFHKLSMLLCIAVCFFFLLQKVVVLGVFPYPLENPEARAIKTNFTYSIPKKTAKCFNLDLPCTPYLNNNLLLMGDTFQDGFKVKK